MRYQNIHSILIEERCKEKGIDCRLLTPNDEEIFVLQKDGRTLYINRAISPRLHHMAAVISENKIATNTLLSAAGLPIPPFMFSHSVTPDVISFFSQHHPIVIKPFDTNKGVGIHLDIDTIEELETAFNEVRKLSELVILQKQAKGKDYRVLVIDQKVAGVLYNEWAYVVGNGQQNLNELIAVENQQRDTVRTPIYHRAFKMLCPVDLADAEKALQQQSLTMSDVPAQGEKVYISSCGNGWAGALAIDQTDRIHPDNVELALQIARVSQIDVLGIDLRCADIAISHKESDFAIIETNIRPSMVDHVYPTHGQSRDVVSVFLDYLFKEM